MVSSEIYRGEHWELSYGVESEYGVDPLTAALTHPLGVFDRGQMADPEIEWTPFFGGGGAQARRFFRAYPGRWAMEMNVGDVMLLDMKALVFPIGTVATTAAYTHTFTEATTLKSMTVHVSAWQADDAAASPTLMRRYLGGKVSRATLTAEENERVRLSFDSILFKDITHNIAAETTKYNSLVARPTVAYPTLNPYFFSGGVLQITGQSFSEATFARVRSFRLDINNSCEAKYYVAGQSPTIPTPYTVLEGKREYTLALVVDPTDTSLYKELVSMSLSGGSPVGIKVVLTISRTASTDDLVISLPGTTPAITAQGCFIKRARIDIDSSQPATPQEMEILARSASIVVHDSDAWTALSD